MSTALPDQAQGLSQKLDAHRTYIDGKMRRYTLLFGVNGAVFAIIQWAMERSESQTNGTWEVVLPGALELAHMAIGSIVFTILMFLDIWAFGSGMKAHYNALFTALGKGILIGVCTLIVCAWVLGSNLLEMRWYYILLGAFVMLLVVGIVEQKLLNRQSSKAPSNGTESARDLGGTEAGGSREGPSR